MNFFSGMIRPVQVSLLERQARLRDLELPLSPWPDDVPVEVEIGFGKGRYLLARAAAEPERGFLGIESAAAYYGLANQRARRLGIRNLVTLCGEALYLIASCLELARADAVHVYFPDPWPKIRHEKRRLLDAENVDLVLSLLRPHGRLFFATDHLEYGEKVAELLAAHPGLTVESCPGQWPNGTRTNYEMKYEREGRAILRLVATLQADGIGAALHPAGRTGVLVGYA